MYGIFTYIYDKNQPFMYVNVPYMDAKGINIYIYYMCIYIYRELEDPGSLTATDPLDIQKFLQGLQWRG